MEWSNPNSLCWEGALSNLMGKGKDQSMTLRSTQIHIFVKTMFIKDFLTTTNVIKK
jgi:hypothetical protein